jgi:acyl carrier protein
LATDKTELSADRVFQLLRRIIKHDFRIPEEDIKPSSSLEELDLDSIDAVDIAVSIEEEIGFQFQPEHLESIRTLQDVVEVVLSGMASR